MLGLFHLDAQFDRIPMTRHPRIHALLSTARVANVPSVASNVLLGAAAVWISSAGGGSQVSAGVLVLPCLAGVFLYLAGNFFNDWMDVTWDKCHRPERALPSGMFRRGSYALTACILGAAGVLVGFAAGSAAGLVCCAIVAGIVAYTILHKRTVWAVGFMGACRGLLVWLGAAAAAPGGSSFPPGVALASAAVTVYVIGLSLVARSESRRRAEQPSALPLASGLFLLVPALVMAIPDLRAACVWCAAGLIPYAVWMIRSASTRRRGVGALVSSLLAGIPLVDWILLLPVGVCHFADGSPGGAAFWWWVPPAAFLAALGLQRLAPAT